MPLRDPRLRRLAAYGALAAIAAGAALGANPAIILILGSCIVLQAWRVLKEPRA